MEDCIIICSMIQSIYKLTRTQFFFFFFFFLSSHASSGVVLSAVQYHPVRASLIFHLELLFRQSTSPVTEALIMTILNLLMTAYFFPLPIIITTLVLSNSPD